MDNGLKKDSNSKEYLDKVFCEDCRDTMSRLPVASIDLVVTSPPYDNLRTYNDISCWSFDIFKEVAIGLSRVLKDGGVIVWIVGDATIYGSETLTSFKQALYFKEELGFNVHDTMIYEKSGFIYPNHTRYNNAFEYMFVFSKGKPKSITLLKDRLNNEFGKPIRGRERNKDGTLTLKNGAKFGKITEKYGRRTNIWKYAIGWMHSYTEDFVKGHPAVMPEKLAKDHILSWSEACDVVYDPFAGSGTVLKQAYLLDRHYIGSEINQEYFKIIERRLKEVQKQKRLF